MSGFPPRILSLLLLTALVGAGYPPSSGARVLASSEAAMVRVEIATLGVALHGAPVVLLREPGARKVVPIFIDPAQARSIAMAMRGASPPRPITHDLFTDTVDALGVRLTRVFVDDVVEGVFLGMLELQVAGREQPIRVDSRPSDALALAVRTGARIYAAPKVLKKAADIDYETPEDQVVTAVGITVGPATERLRAALDLPDIPGVLVTQVFGPARRQGMAPGALLLQVNGEAATTPMQFLELIRRTAKGENATIRYWQEGEEHRIAIATDVPDREAQTPNPPEGQPL